MTISIHVVPTCRHLCPQHSFSITSHTECYAELWNYLLARQAKPGASCRVKVPVGEGRATHPYRLLRHGRTCGEYGMQVFEAQKGKPGHRRHLSPTGTTWNKHDEAYTEHRAGRRGRRESLKVDIAPKCRFGRGGL